MQRFVRSQVPDWLALQWEAWGQRYADNRQKNPAFKFQWPTHEGQVINQKLLPLLSRDTQHHCAYCDSIPRDKEKSIDHFRPKSHPENYRLVCHWENLYFVCTQCQNIKMEKFDNLLLRPDSPDYSFDKYFLYDFSLHHIKPRPGLNELDLSRAIVTIELLGMNMWGNPQARKRFLDNQYSETAPSNYENLPFRFMLG